MLTKSGAKLMDFGLAKQSGVAPLAGALTEMTLEQPKLTSDGMIVGTFQYTIGRKYRWQAFSLGYNVRRFGEHAFRIRVLF